MVPSKPLIRLLFPLFLAVATLCAYGPALGAGFIWDDDDYVLHAPAYAAENPLKAIWLSPRSTPQYYPVVFTSFYLERQAWGLNPAGFHVVNVLLHAGSAWVLWRVLERLKVPGAMFGAALFALHPMMVESVAWVTERKNTLCLLFALLSLLTFLRFAGIGREAEAPVRARWRWYAGSLGLFVLAMLSKSVACGLAPVLVLLLWWRAEARGQRARYLATLPYFALGLLGGLHTAYLEVHHVGARGETWQLGMAEKVLLAGQALWFYAGKLVFPHPLSFYYTRWALDPAAWWQWLAPAAAVAALALVAAGGRAWGRGPTVAGLAFVAVLFPALGFFAVFPMIFSWVADHFAYPASAVMLPALGALLALGARRLRLGPAMRGTLAAMLLLALAAKTHATAGNYRSFRTLWSSVLAYDPARPHWNALSGMSMVLHEEAAELRAQGHLAEALEKDDAARACDERSIDVRPEYALGYVNLASDALLRGDAAKALPLAEKAVALDPREAAAHYALGRARDRLRQPREALEAYERAVALAPRKVLYRLALSRALLGAGQEQAARVHARRALELEGTTQQGAEAWLLLAYDDAAAMRFERALPAFRKALQLDPGSAEIANGYARAVALWREQGDAELPAALAAAQRAVDATRGTVPAYVETLALVQHRLGRRQEAVNLLHAALRETPPEAVEIRESIQQHLAMVEMPEAGASPETRPGTRPVAPLNGP